MGNIPKIACGSMKNNAGAKTRTELIWPQALPRRELGSSHQVNRESPARRSCVCWPVYACCPSTVTGGSLSPSHDVQFWTMKPRVPLLRGN